MKLNTVVVKKNICPTGDRNKSGSSPLTGNSCVERHVCKMICGSISKTSMRCPEELHWPTDGSCSPTRVGKHLGRSKQAGGAGEEDD